MKKYIFFRNDDVREHLDESLVKITELLTDHDVPICHTVEPKNVSSEVVNWLLEKKNNHPDLIEIVQHGYSHKLNYKTKIGGKLKKGEFGGTRGYEEQYQEIKEGKDILDEYFGDKWFKLFTFPYGARNSDALKAVSDTGFKVVNGSMAVSAKHKLFYGIGRILNKEMLYGRKISYNLRHRKNLNLFQIDTSISVITRYLNEGTEATFYSLEELKSLTLEYLKSTPTFGIVLHHRYHNSDAKIKLLEDYIVWLKNLSEVEFVTQEFIYNKYSKQ